MKDKHMQNPKASQNNNVSINDYSELIKTVARIEYSRLSTSSYLIDFSELINIGATAVYVILTSHSEKDHNDSYISTAIKWAIRNELRRRYKWYSFKHTSKEEDDNEANDELNLNKSELREAVYETIFSVEELAESDNPVQIEDSSCTPEQKIEFIELSKCIRDALKHLPEKERVVLEYRFYKNIKVKDIAQEFNVTSSRISKIIQSGLDKIKNRLVREGML